MVSPLKRVFRSSQSVKVGEVRKLADLSNKSNSRPTHLMAFRVTPIVSIIS